MFLGMCVRPPRCPVPTGERGPAVCPGREQEPGPLQPPAVWDPHPGAGAGDTRGAGAVPAPGPGSPGDDKRHPGAFPRPSPPERPSPGHGCRAPPSPGPVSVKPGVPRGTCQSASVPPSPAPSRRHLRSARGGNGPGDPPEHKLFGDPGPVWGSHGLSRPASPRCWEGMAGGAGGCWGSPPHHLVVPQHAVKVRGKDGPPGCCLSTFPARPSVRNGEALSGIRRWLRVIVPLPPQPQHPKHRARGAGTAGSPGKAAE